MFGGFPEYGGQINFSANPARSFLARYFFLRGLGEKLVIDWNDENIILSTEHGPRGGDEINNIFFNKNYGWPISSYGDSYFEKNKIKYKKDHFSHGFKEPVFSFVPSIGISELIKLPNNFSAYWKDNFIVSSLNGSSLYRIKFNEGLNKIISYEKIYIGERVRDLKYNNQDSLLNLYLELEY